MMHHRVKLRKNRTTRGWVVIYHD